MKYFATIIAFLFIAGCGLPQSWSVEGKDTTPEQEQEIQLAIEYINDQAGCELLHWSDKNAPKTKLMVKRGNIRIISKDFIQTGIQGKAMHRVRSGGDIEILKQNFYWFVVAHEFGHMRFSWGHNDPDYPDGLMNTITCDAEALEHGVTLTPEQQLDLRTRCGL